MAHTVCRKRGRGGSACNVPSYFSRGGTPKGANSPPCAQHLVPSSSPVGSSSGSSSTGFGAVGGMPLRNVSSAADAMNAAQIGSVGIWFLTRNMSATCTTPVLGLSDSGNLPSRSRGQQFTLFYYFKSHPVDTSGQGTMGDLRRIVAPTTEHALQH